MKSLLGYHQQSNVDSWAKQIFNPPDKYVLREVFRSLQVFGEL